MENTKEPKQILNALMRVADAVDYLQKDRYNKSQNFAYNSESAVKGEFHRQFLRQGLLFTCSEKEIVTEPHVNKDGAKAGYLTRVTLEITLMHVESEEYLSFIASGHGYDGTDKSIGKAYSYAIKTWLLNGFLVQTGEDADQVDENDDKFNKPKAEEAFDAMMRKLKKLEPKKGEAKRQYEAILGDAKTHSGHPVGHPSEFKSYADSLGAYRALQQLESMWYEQKMAEDAQSGKATVHEESK